MKLKNSLLLVSTMLTVLSCTNRQLSKVEDQDEAFKTNSKEVLQEVKDMLRKDQDIRKFRLYGTTDSTYIDSLTNAYAKHGVDLDAVLLKNDTFLVNRKVSDSVNRAMSKQDDKHLARMIALINKYGYPESSRIDTTTNISPFLILHHTSMKYKDTLRKLLTTELELKRIDTIGYHFILWDLEGRKGLPPINFSKVSKNEDGSTTIEL